MSDEKNGDCEQYACDALCMQAPLVNTSSPSLGVEAPSVSVESSRTSVSPVAPLEVENLKRRYTEPSDPMTPEVAAVPSEGIHHRLDVEAPLVPSGVSARGERVRRAIGVLVHRRWASWGCSRAQEVGTSGILPSHLPFNCTTLS